MKTTEQLLKMSDDELLIAAASAYWGLMGVTKFRHRDDKIICRDGCSKCLAECDGHKNCALCTQDCPVPDPIPGCIEKVAFQMRDACDGFKGMYWATELDKVFDANRRRSSAHLLANSTAKQWIIAGMLAWEAKS